MISSYTNTTNLSGFYFNSDFIDSKVVLKLLCILWFAGILSIQRYGDSKL